MHHYREAIQHYITHGQKVRINTMTTSPFSFICGALILFINLFFGIKKYWWIIGILMTIFISVIICICCVKDEYTRLFYKHELFSVSLFISLIFLLIFLVDYFFDAFLYCVFICGIASVIGVIIMQILFIKS